MKRQVPRRPSTFTPTPHRNAEFLAVDPKLLRFVKLLSETSVYLYFHYRREKRLLPLPSNPIRSEKARFEGIAPRRRPWTECMCCMRCTLCLDRVRIVPCTFAVSHATDMWDTRYPGSLPVTLARFAHPHLFLCTSISIELPEPGCCRGTISVSPPWHPFPSAMATNASYHAHVNISIKLLKTCICHPHHDNNI